MGGRDEGEVAEERAGTQGARPDLAGPRTRDASRAHEDSLRLLVDGVVDYAIFMLDANGHVASWNAGAHRLKQYREEEIRGRHFSAFYPEEARAAGLPDRLLATAAAAGRVEDEGWRVRKDGSLFWANVVITALRTPEGKLYGFAKVTRDLTERRDHEQQLKHSEERMRLMVERVIDYAIFMLDPDGTVATWNEGARRLKGYEAEEIIGRHFSRFYPADDQLRGRPQHLLEQATRDGRVEDEGWRVRKDGSRFWADVVITSLRGGDGSLQGFAKVTRDLTERRRAEDELREMAEREHAAAEQLRAADRDRQNLVAVVAHDLRAPVGVLHGTADMLVRDWDRLTEENRQKMLLMMLSTSSRLSTLVDDVLDASRLETGRLRYDVGRVDLAAVIVRAVNDLDPHHRQITVTTPAVTPTVLGDERRIWQIVSNLVGNALKFSADAAPVEILVEADDRMATVSVTDRGPGISEVDQGKLFQPFSRVGSPGAPGGSGLGLYIARSLATAQGGDIGVRSTLGAGSTFFFTIPLSS